MHMYMHMFDAYVVEALLVHTVHACVCSSW